MIGKQIRLERILNRDTGKTVIVPMDQGLTEGPLPGIADIMEAVALSAEGGADAVVLHKGMVARGYRGRGPDMGLLVQLSGNTALSPFPDRKALVCTVEEAVRCGADGVSLHVSIGDRHEKKMLADLGRVAGTASEWGMPLLAMVFAVGRKAGDQPEPDMIKHAARVGAELGADMVGVRYRGDVASLREMTRACPVPVLISCALKRGSVPSLLERVKEAMKAGAAGISISRDALGHENPAGILAAVSMIVHGKGGMEAALREAGDFAVP